MSTSVAEPLVSPITTPSVDLHTVIAGITDRLPVIAMMEADDRMVVGSLFSLLSDALIYLRRHEAEQESRRAFVADLLGPRDHGEG